MATTNRKRPSARPDRRKLDALINDLVSGKATEKGTHGEVIKQIRKQTEGRNAIDIDHNGEPVISTRSFNSAHEALNAREKEMTQDYAINRTFNGLPLDVANATSEMARLMFGMVAGVTKCSMFGDNPPRQIQARTGTDSSTLVPWGTFEIPAIGAELTMECRFTSSGPQTRISGTCKKHVAETIEAFLRGVSSYLRNSSIYRGQAFRLSMKWLDRDPDTLDIEEVQPDFIPTTITPSDVFLPETTRNAIQANLWTPIQSTETCKASGLPVSRRIILSGRYGTGKTMLANATANVAASNGWTFMYIKETSRLAKAMEIGVNYGPCVIFVEDIDSEISIGEDGDISNRSAKDNEILNTLDGIDTKGTDLIIVMTTNHPEKLPPVLLRPGRCDALIDIPAPDGPTSLLILEAFVEGSINYDIPRNELQTAVSGMIPASLREVVSRAAYHSIAANEPVENPTASALAAAASTLRAQQSLIETQLSRKPAPRTVYERGCASIADAIRDAPSLSSAALALNGILSNHGTHVAVEPHDKDEDHYINQPTELNHALDQHVATTSELQQDDE